jgi:hypothetical protein
MDNWVCGLGEEIMVITVRIKATTVPLLTSTLSSAQCERREKAVFGHDGPTPDERVFLNDALSDDRGVTSVDTTELWPSVTLHTAIVVRYSPDAAEPISGTLLAKTQDFFTLACRPSSTSRF